MSAENFFQVAEGGILFVFMALLCILCALLPLLAQVLWGVSTWFVVRFDVDVNNLWGCQDWPINLSIARAALIIHSLDRDSILLLPKLPIRKPRI